MQALERAADLLRGANSLDRVAEIFRELGFPRNLLPLDDDALAALGLTPIVSAARIAEGAGGFENRSRRWKSRGPVLMELLLYRPTVVGLAVLGALLAVAASLLRAAGKLNEVQAKRLNVVAYVVMGASMLLFALAGLRGVPA